MRKTKTKITREDLIGETRFTVMFVCQYCIKKSNHGGDYWRKYNEDLHCYICGNDNDNTYFKKVDESGKLVRLDAK